MAACACGSCCRDVCVKIVCKCSLVSVGKCAHSIAYYLLTDAVTETCALELVLSSRVSTFPTDPRPIAFRTPTDRAPRVTCMKLNKCTDTFVDERTSDDGRTNTPTPRRGDDFFVHFVRQVRPIKMEFAVCVRVCT